MTPKLPAFVAAACAAFAGLADAHASCLACEDIYAADERSVLWRIDPDTGLAQNLGLLPYLADIAITSDGRMFGGGGGNLYAIDDCAPASATNVGWVFNATGMGGDLATNHIFAGGPPLYDTETSGLYAQTPIGGTFGALPPAWCGVVSGDLAMNPADGYLYGTLACYGCGGDSLARIDPLTGDVVNVVGCIRTPGGVPFDMVFGLAFTGSGRLFGGRQSMLLEIDPLTAIATAIPTSGGISTIGGLAALLPCVEEPCTATDTTPPALTCPPAATVNADAACEAEPPPLGASDTCDPWPLVSASPSPLSGTGVHPVTYTALDAAGNTATCSTPVTVVDVTPPSIVCVWSVGPCGPGGGNGGGAAGGGVDTNGDGLPDAGEAPCGTKICAGAYAYDTCGAHLITDSLGPGADPIQHWVDETLLGAGLHTIVFTATDASGNVATCNVEVNVVDTTPPALVCGEVATAATSSVGDVDGFHVGDPGDATVAGPFFSGCPDASDTVVGTDEKGRKRCRVWNHVYAGVSACLPSARLTVRWQLASRRSPTPYDCVSCPSLPGSPMRPDQTLTLESAAGRVDLGPCDDVFSGAFFGNCPAPAIDGTTTLELADIPGALALLDGSPLTVALAGETSVDWARLDLGTVTGAAPAPVPTEPGLCCGVATVGACASDACEGEATISNVIDPDDPGGALATTCWPLGTTAATFSATDGSGNVATCTTPVTVFDAEAPVVLCPPVTLLPLGAPVPPPIVTDNCDPAPAVTWVGPVPTSKPRQVLVTYTATDASGNSASTPCIFRQ